MPSISFIIPTYNSLHLIKRCLNSIENQIEQSDKIIIIDDGSTDGTKDYLNEKYTNISNIITLSQENLGSGPARNAGLSKSDTDYVWFVDADDYIKEGSVKIVKKKLMDSKNDVLFIEHIMKNKDIHKKCNLSFNVSEIKEVLLTQHYPWNKVIKRTLFQGIEFPNEKIRYQDVATIPRILLVASNIGILHEAVYFYDFSHSQNITKNIKKEKDIFVACDYLVRNLKDKNYKELELILFHLFIFNRIYFSPEKKLKSIFSQVDGIKMYLDNRVPQWRQSEYLKKEFGRKYNKHIPFLEIKLIIGNVFKYSSRITSLIVLVLRKLKPLIK